MRLFSLFCTGLLIGAGVPALSDITRFEAVTPLVDVSAGQSAEFIVASDTDGQAIVRFFGPDWRPAGEIALENMRANATTRVEWVPRDETGAPLPDEAYFATVEFSGHDGSQAALDRSTNRAIGEVLVQNPQYDPEAGGVRFSLAIPARVTLLAGIDGGGPLMHTLLSGVPYPAGDHLLPWDGYDQSRALKITDDERFRLFVSGREIVGPSVIVRGSSDVPYFEYTRALEQDGVPIKDGISIEEFGGASHVLPKPEDVSPEPVFSLSVPNAPLNDSNMPIVSGEVPLTVSLGDKIKVPVLARRFEIVLFHNYDFTTEIEEGRSPATIVWDATKLPSGIYLLTINVATLPGQMSAASLYVDLRN